jgi:hypothetical protein
MKTFLQWAKGILRGFIYGASSAGLGWGGLAAAKGAGLDVPTLNFKALGILLLIGGISHSLAVLQKSPIWNDDDTKPGS